MKQLLIILFAMLVTSTSFAQSSVVIKNESLYPVTIELYYKSFKSWDSLSTYDIEVGKHIRCEVVRGNYHSMGYIRIDSFNDYVTRFYSDTLILK